MPMGLRDNLHKNMKPKPQKHPEKKSTLSSILCEQTKVCETMMRLEVVSNTSRNIMEIAGKNLGDVIQLLRELSETAKKYADEIEIITAS